MANDASDRGSRNDGERRLFRDESDESPFRRDGERSQSRERNIFDDPVSRNEPAGDVDTSPFARPRVTETQPEPAASGRDDNRPPRDDFGATRDSGLRRDRNEDAGGRESGLFRTESPFDQPRGASREPQERPASGGRSSSLFNRDDDFGSPFGREPAPRNDRWRGDDPAPAAGMRGGFDREPAIERRPPANDGYSAPPRLDRISERGRDGRDAAANFEADRPRYSPQQGVAGSGPSPFDDRGRSDTPREPPVQETPPAEDYYDPRSYEEFDPSQYQGVHARELADVDNQYAREYQYTDESVDFRRAEPSGFEEYPRYEGQYDEMREPPRRRRGPFLLLGSLIGVAAIAGGLILVYKQGIYEGQQDQVPVVEANQEPVKVEPDEPSGLEVSHRTKLIYERIIGEVAVPDETLQTREEPLLDPSNQPAGQINPTGAPAQPGTNQAFDGQPTGNEPLPLPLPPPPSAVPSGQSGSLQSQTTQVAAVQPPPLPDSSVPSTVLQPIAPSDNAALQQPQPDQQQPATAAADDPISRLLANPPVPIDKPIPPSRLATPGPAVPSGPVQINPLPGSVPAENTQQAALQAQQSGTSPINLQPGQPVSLEPAQPAVQQPAQPSLLQQQTQQNTTRVSGSRFSGEGSSLDVGGQPLAATQQPSLTQPAAPAVQAPVTQAPATLAPVTQAPAEQVAAINPAPAIAPAPAPPPGSFLVQLASFRTQQEAEQEFSRLQGRHGSLLQTYRPYIQQADLGSRGIYYRLRIGPIQNRQSASQLCNSLISAGERDCFVGQ